MEQVIVTNKDLSTGSIVSITQEHHEIHEGHHFFYQDFVSLNTDAVFDFCVQTPNTSVWTHITWELLAKGEFIFQMYKDSDITFDGTDLTSINNNLNSSNVSNWANFESGSTIVDAGTLFGQSSVGDSTNPVSRIPGAGERSKELILKQNTSYIFRITSKIDNNIISADAEWYEHESVE